MSARSLGRCSSEYRLVEANTNERAHRSGQAIRKPDGAGVVRNGEAAAQRRHEGMQVRGRGHARRQGVRYHWRSKERWKTARRGDEASDGGGGIRPWCRYRISPSDARQRPSIDARVHETLTLRVPRPHSLDI
jgi:hypothetical protein